MRSVAWYYHSCYLSGLFTPKPIIRAVFSANQDQIYYITWSIHETFSLIQTLSVSIYYAWENLLLLVNSLVRVSCYKPLPLSRCLISGTWLDGTRHGCLLWIPMHVFCEINKITKELYNNDSKHLQYVHSHFIDLKRPCLTTRLCKKYFVI